MPSSHELTSSRAEAMGGLRSLRIGDQPERWEALGFAVADAVCELGGVCVWLDGAGPGITAWSVDGVEGSIDGLTSFAGCSPRPGASHPNGAIGIDHVVIVSPDFERTSLALDAAGLGLRRIRDAGGFRQGFRRIGPAILELVEAPGSDAGEPARFWGLVVIVADLDALAERLGDQLGTVRPAVQPGRRIATLRESAGVGTKVAFMDPEVATLA
jgi:hypothetical protein